jgi:hypothetical protein
MANRPVLTVSLILLIIFQITKAEQDNPAAALRIKGIITAAGENSAALCRTVIGKRYSGQNPFPQRGQDIRRLRTTAAFGKGS